MTLNILNTVFPRDNDTVEDTPSNTLSMTIFWHILTLHFVDDHILTHPHVTLCRWPYFDTSSRYTLSMTICWHILTVYTMIWSISHSTY